MTEFELGWLAGILDGEGAIGMGRDARPGHDSYIPAIQVNMTCEPTVRKVTALFDALGGGRKEPYHIKPRKKHHREAWFLRVTRARSIRAILEAVGPHLVTKAEQGRLLLEYVTSRTDPPRGSLYTDREREIYTQLRDLNRRGA